MKLGADKVLCMAGIAALAASTGWFVSSKDIVSVDTLADLGAASARNSVGIISAPTISSEQPLWEAPVSQDKEDPNWVYGIFTPPVIYKVDGKFSAQPPTGPIELPPEETIELRLVAFEQPLYRFQFESYVEEDPDDPSKNLAMLFDRETGSSVRARVGREFSEQGIRVVDIDIVRTLDASSGVMQATERVQLEEIDTGRKVMIQYGVPKYSDNYTIRIESTISSGSVEIGQDATSFTLDDMLYEVTEINTEAESIGVRRLSTEEASAEEYVSDVLSLTTATTQPATAVSSGTTLF